VISEVDAGRAAILRGSWAEARRHFERALEAGETAEALDGLGVAARSLLEEEPPSTRTSAAIALPARPATMFAQCRIQYGELLVSSCGWTQAEAELDAVCRDFRLRRNAFDAAVRLAELRRRQGREDEAAALVEQVRDHRLAPIVRAGLALDRRDAAAAAEEAERYLRRVHELDRFERTPALELLVQAKLALGDTAGAEAAAAELGEIAARGRTTALRAAALLARGRVAVAQGAPGGIEALDDDADLYRACGARARAARPAGSPSVSGLGRPQCTRARGPAACREGPLQRGDRGRARPERAHCRVACREHLRQGRRVRSKARAAATA
jgi:hypothetical protein